VSDRRKIPLVAATSILIATLLLQPVAHVNAQPQAGDYIVTELMTGVLSRVTPGGVRTPIFTFAAGADPVHVAIDSGGNYIVVEGGTEVLSKVTPSGVRTVIFTFAGGTGPSGVAIDSGGNYIVVEGLTQMLSKVTPGGVRTVIFTFERDTYPSGVAIIRAEAPLPPASGIGIAVMLIGIGAGTAVALVGFAIVLSRAKPMNYCRYCGRPVPPNARHCQWCRRALVW